MAEKKYVSLSKLGYYDEKIKKYIGDADAAILAQAEALGSNYDVAGAAKTVQDNLDAEVLRATTKEDELVAKDTALQKEIDDLETLVGTLPTGTEATSVVDYVNKKTEGIATDAALGELNSQVSGLQTAVKAIQDDYLVEADKTELANAIGAEKTRAEGIESGLRTDVDAIKGDYLKNADKDTLQGNIDAVSDKVDTLIGEDAGKSARTIANEELAKQLIADGAKESLDTLAEIAAWIQSHPDDASAMNKAIEDLETLVGTLPADVTATTIVGYIQEAVAAEKTRAEGIEAGLAERITNLETSVGDGGSVQDMIDESVDAAIATEVARVDGLLENKVGKVDGKGLSTNDLTDELKANYDVAYDHSIAAHAPVDAQANIIESIKVNGTALTIADKAVDITVPTDNAQLTNGAGYITADAIANKADKGTTLASYGIADAYTSAETDSAIATAMSQFVEVSEAEINAMFQQ